MKGYSVRISQKGNPEAHASTLKSSTRIHTLLGNSKIHCHSQTYIQCPALQSSCYFFSQWIVINSLFQCTLPVCFRFHLEMLMTKTNSFLVLPFSSTQSLGKFGHLLRAVTCLQSFVGIPFSTTQSLRRSSPWKDFLTSKFPKTKAYPWLKTIILVITFS